jgi:hypothetical protein
MLLARLSRKLRRYVRKRPAGYYSSGYPIGTSVSSLSVNATLRLSRYGMALIQTIRSTVCIPLRPLLLAYEKFILPSMI